MTTGSLPGADIERGSGRGAETFERPAEVVDVSERLYRQVFAAGLWVAVGCTALAGLGALLQPTAGQLRGAAACALCIPAIVAAAMHPGWVYARTRRHPWALLGPAAILGGCALIAGIRSYQLFVPMCAVIGTIGLAAPARVVVAAGLVSALGLAAPQIIEGRSDVAGAIAVVAPPLMFWLIVDRIAGFALHLHQTLATTASPSPRQSADGGETARRREPDNEEGVRRAARERRALPAAAIVHAKRTRLTSRQLQVLLLACEGLKHAEIGACLGIGPQQVRRHLRDARERVGADSTPALVAWARQTGLVPRPASQR